MFPLSCDRQDTKDRKVFDFVKHALMSAKFVRPKMGPHNDGLYFRQAISLASGEHKHCFAAKKYNPRINLRHR